jgi:sucrose-phosphate synthase
MICRSDIQLDETKQPAHIVLISIHGLVRGHNLELGRDADTGGQVKYVIELARALGEHPDVERVTLLTRRVIDATVSPDYAEIEECLSPKSSIVRIECGEARYLRKEMLWDSLENFADNAYSYLKKQGRVPDIIHGHYADAGYVGARLSHRLGVPLVFTGHSLGRNKRNQLLAGGVKRSDIETTYSISRRIEAEETTLAAAQRIITSTQQEIEFQYGLYDFYQPSLMRVIPPGTDLVNFYPPRLNESSSFISDELKRFLQKPRKPMILAIARPDPKKNFLSLITAYGESEELKKSANLVLVAGNRDDIREMEDVSKTTMNDLLLAIDRYDLYGKVAFPKHHKPGDIATLLRLATTSRGVFVNPALTEPFGLTLIESAASGLPVVATEDGGPSDILHNCKNGYLVNPLDTQTMAATLLKTLSNAKQWKQFSKNGIENVSRFYSWKSHVEQYLSVIQPLIAKQEFIERLVPKRHPGFFRDSALFTSLDLNLIGDPHSLSKLLEVVKANRKHLIFGIATGRRLGNALSALRQHQISVPDVLITGQGTEIHYAAGLTKDTAWQRHINHLWNPQAVREVLNDVRGLVLQSTSEQSSFQVSYFIDSSVVSVQDIKQLLQRNELSVNVVNSFGQFLDILPLRASKGLALRWCAEHFDFQLENTLVAGVSGADADMLIGNTLGTVVDSRHRDELTCLENSEHVFFSSASYAAGILEAMDFYGFPRVKK